MCCGFSCSTDFRSAAWLVSPSSIGNDCGVFAPYGELNWRVLTLGDDDGVDRCWGMGLVVDLLQYGQSTRRTFSTSSTAISDERHFEHMVCLQDNTFGFCAAICAENLILHNPQLMIYLCRYIEVFDYSERKCKKKYH